MLNTKLVAFVPRNKIVNPAENNRQTRTQYAPDSPQTDVYRKLAETILTNENLTIPTPVSFDDLEKLVRRYGTEN